MRCNIILSAPLVDMYLSVILGLLLSMMLDNYDFITMDLLELELVVVSVTDHKTIDILESGFLYHHYCLGGIFLSVSTPV